MIKNNKAGISLIVLIITVIVMVILASATVITLNEANIIRNSKDAVQLSELTLTNIGTIYVTMNAKINLYSAYSNVVGV